MCVCVFIHLYDYNIYYITFSFCLYFQVPHRYNTIPLVKFLGRLTSHFYLIFLLTVTVAIPLNPIWAAAGTFIPFWYEWLLLAWFGGQVVSELTNPGDKTGRPVE